MTMTRSNFTGELERVRTEILAMATRVEEDLRKAIQALRERDSELASWVKADDTTVNAMQEKIQYLAAILMATQQPVAQDLREMVAAIRLADNLERMGDYAVHLAKTAIKLRDSSWPLQFGILGEMAEIGCAMIRSMIDAYMKKDVAAAIACSEMDSKVDELHHRLMSLTMDGLKCDSARAEEAIKLIRTSGFLERLADHVTNSCELVAYMVSGAHAELNE